MCIQDYLTFYHTHLFSIIFLQTYSQLCYFMDKLSQGEGFVTKLDIRIFQLFILFLRVIWEGTNIHAQVGTY